MSVERQDPAQPAISASLRPLVDRSGYAGRIDAVTPHELRGWVLDRAEPGAELVVTVHLDDALIGIARTGIPREEVKLLPRRPVAPGFLLDFDAPWVRGRIKGVLATRSGTRDEPLTLTVTVHERAGAEGRTRTRPVRSSIALPEGVEARRPLRDWLAFFDLDPDALAAELIPPAARTNLTPVPDGDPAAARFIAFYLPQYHPVPQNDRWWGPGFTDWTGVATTERLFPDHVAPNVPADLGFYDLRLRETRARQAALARDYGIYGFCYYFYWFSGQRILEQPLALLLSDGEPDLPFCLCWANEPWTRRWDGSDVDVLLPQEHALPGDLAILDDLLPFFEDPRYIRIDGRPLVLVYRSGLLPDRAGFVRGLRERARAEGLPGLFLCNVLSVGETDASGAGFDAAVEFPPNGVSAGELDAAALGAPPDFGGHVFGYEDSVALVTAAGRRREEPYFPGAMPRWDNSPRRGRNADLFHGATPELFEHWLRSAAEVTQERNPDAPLVFINSWNEWGEGAYLEPDRRFGRRFLEAVRRVGFDDPGDEDGVTSLQHRVAALEVENRILLKQLVRAQLATAPIPMIAGVPEPLLGAGEREPGGRGVLETLDGAGGLGSVVAARRDAPHVLTGWFCGDDARSGHPGGSGYVRLRHLIDDRVYHGPVTSRSPRPDVASAFGIDAERDHLGFSVRFDITAVEPGIHALDFIEVLPGRVVEINAGILVEVV